MKHSGKIVASGGVNGNKLKVIDCEFCGFAHLYLIPKDTEKYYNDDKFYKTHSPPNWLENVKKEHAKGLWHSAYRMQREMFSPTIDTLVDWGCGEGWFVYEWLVKRGVAVGIEPSKMARNFIPILTPFIYEKEEIAIKHISKYGHNFHIRLSLLLEHLPDPLAFLQRMRKYIGNSKGANIMIIVPNEFNPLQKRIGGDEGFFVSKVHINYFTPNSLRGLMEKAGFEIISETATFPIEIFPAIGLDYRRFPWIGNYAFMVRLYSEKWFPKTMANLYKKLYDKYGIGREIIFVGRGAQ